MIENINDKTGVITEFVTRYTYQNDIGEEYEPGTSETDVTQFEPIGQLVKRIVRGTMIPRQDLVFSEEVDETSRPGFDIADAVEVLHDVNSTVLSAKQEKKESAVAANIPASDETLGKSDEK